MKSVHEQIKLQIEGAKKVEDFLEFCKTIKENPRYIRYYIEELIEKNQNDQIVDLISDEGIKIKEYILPVVELIRSEFIRQGNYYLDEENIKRHLSNPIIKMKNSFISIDEVINCIKGEQTKGAKKKRFEKWIVQENLELHIQREKSFKRKPKGGIGLVDIKGKIISISYVGFRVLMEKGFFV